MTTNTSDRVRRRFGRFDYTRPVFSRNLSLAVYLGVSWTWCIGMFLPVILVGEFGLWAWVVFAVPNVLGAAAMGWVLARPGASERIVAGHAAACVGFSAVTVAFHLFFLFWLTSTGLIAWPLSIAATAGGVVLGLVGPRGRLRVDLLLAWAVLVVSLVVMGRGLMTPKIGVPHPTQMDHAVRSLVGLAPVCVLGFLLCPYLDVTFHRARQNTDAAGSRFAFGTGFGLVFGSMIVLTLMYAGDFTSDQIPGDHFGSFGWEGLQTWVATHLCVQAGFTIMAHLRALPRPRPFDGISWGASLAFAVVGAVAVHRTLWVDQKLVSNERQMLTGEFVYRLFMSFYGLVFPAYVWICMVPLLGRAPGPTRKALIVTAVSIVLAAPFFWYGFLREQMAWLPVGVGIVLAAKALVLPSKVSSPEESPWPS